MCIGMCGGSIQTTRSIAVGIHIITTSECTCWIRSPFMEVAHHIVNPFCRHTTRRSSRQHQAFRQLIDTWVTDVGKNTRHGMAKIFASWVNTAIFVAPTRLLVVAVGIRVVLWSATSSQPFAVGTKTLTCQFTSIFGLYSRYVSLGNHPCQRHCFHLSCPRVKKWGPRLLRTIRQHFYQDRFILIDAKSIYLKHTCWTTSLSRFFHFPDVAGRGWNCAARTSG